MEVSPSRDELQSPFNYRISYFCRDAGSWVCLLDVPSHAEIRLLLLQSPNICKRLQEWRDVPAHCSFAKVEPTVVPALLRALARSEATRLCESLVRDDLGVGL